ncbi:MAG: flagellar assembly protein FliW [Bdellovibrionaceae bacterium]|nr:flagellar assembly protein FliW [Pseudobdellovibrionaceae bacterium]NUM57147.1 flagellar assembly protein FliW [Pseudobdellovibrionaceae bacterium]
MLIQTSRFGQVKFESDDVINFPEGLLGFSDLRKFVLVDDPSDEIFIWLQSCESPQIAFPLLEPELFVTNYQPGLTKTDLESLKLSHTDKTRSFCVITIPDDPTQMSANMKAPIIINMTLKIARQCVLQDNSLAIREPIFTKLQQRVVQNPQVCIKEQLNGTSQAVKVSRPSVNL